MSIKKKNVAIIVDNYFEQEEFTEPKEALEQAGASVDVIAPEPGQVQGVNHIEMADKFDVDRVLDEVDNWSDYDALVLPGGAINADHLRMNETAQTVVRDFLDSGKPVAVICHAPWVLVSAGVAGGCDLTSYYTIQDDMINAGANWQDSEVVVDGNLITSRKPDDLPAFNNALISMLQEK